MREIVHAGDIVVATVDPVLNRPFIVGRCLTPPADLWATQMPLGTLLLVVKASLPAATTVTALYNGQMIEVFLSDVELLDVAEQ